MNDAFRNDCSPISIDFSLGHEMILKQSVFTQHLFPIIIFSNEFHIATTKLWNAPQ